MSRHTGETDHMITHGTEGAAGAAERLAEDAAVVPARAARELRLRREEFRLAVELGLVRTVPAPGPAPDSAPEPAPDPGAGSAPGPDPGAGPGPGASVRRRVLRSEIDRLRAAPDFPDGLRERVRAVGTREGAEILGVTGHRFTRLARTGHFTPVRCYVNRYRAVVWLYPAAELAEFALNNPRLLSGRLPLDVRIKADDPRVDFRARNWRARRLGLLLRATRDPWARAAAIASVLDGVQVAEIVDDPQERSRLDELRPGPPSWWPTAAAARETAERLLLADDPDELLWHRLSLGIALTEARARRTRPPGANGALVRAAGTTGATRPAATSTSTSTPIPLPFPVRFPTPVVRPASVPLRPTGAGRPPGRRVRRTLLDRLRGRKGAVPTGER
ncbi:DUF6397 family protein [Streptomyces sp. NPDC090025]|uniref:DUF6397 family protein n=1 Tax=Streptomyces sp. NPDC090025 TaxID=3365922 RepID=UPI003835AB8B